LPPSGGAASVPPRTRRRSWAGTWRRWGSLGGARADPARADGGLRDDHPESRLEVALRLGQPVHDVPYWL